SHRLLHHVTTPPTRYTLSLHDALPISSTTSRASTTPGATRSATRCCATWPASSAGWAPSPASRPATAARNSRSSSPARMAAPPRSEEHTSELQSLRHLVCRLLLEKKNT